MSVFGFNKNKCKYDVYTKEETDTIANNKSDIAHNHDSRYYTRDEVDTIADKKSNTSHNHDTRYYTKAEVDKKITGNYKRGTAAPSSSSGSDGDIYDQYF